MLSFPKTIFLSEIPKGTAAKAQFLELCEKLALKLWKAHGTQELGAFFAHGTCAEVRVMRETRDAYGRSHADQKTEHIGAHRCKHRHAYVQVHCMHAGPLRITLGLLRLFLGCLVLCPTIAWCIITLPPPVLFVLLDFSQCQVSFHLQSELGSWLGTATVTFGSQERKHVFSTVCKHKRILLQSLFGIHPVFRAASEVHG